MSGSSPDLVVAFDFGTTYSGYAFSFRHEFLKDPIKCSQTIWSSGVGGLQSHKTSTCVLFDVKGKFHSFGFEAEENYSNLALDNKNEDWFFFRRFKMSLFNENTPLKREFTLKEENGKSMEAMVVFSSAIRYMKDHFMERLENKATLDTTKVIIDFVLTVPAIWNDQARQFMREAAEKAGINKERLRIALEPEVASLYCKHLPRDSMVDENVEVDLLFEPGKKYIILDAGGGTVDITVHEVEHGGTLKEICKANGGDWGGTKIDDEFRNLLISIVGENVWSRFRNEHKYDMLGLFTEFEIKKRTIKSDMTGRVIFRVPVSLSQLFKELNKGADIQTKVNADQQFSGKLSWLNDKIIMNAEVVKGLFSETNTEIFRHILRLTKDERVRKADFILMIGGFSECEILISYVRKFLSLNKIIVPNEAGLAVLKGAVIYGHNPQAIDGRICKYTYGIKTSKSFDRQSHDPRKLYTSSDGRKWCTDIFNKHAEIGEMIKFSSETLERSYSVLEATQTTVSFKIFISTETDPTYVTDPSCTEIGFLTLEMPGKGLDRSATVRMIFSGTELEVKATNDDTGTKVSVTIDLLQ